MGTPGSWSSTLWRARTTACFPPSSPGSTHRHSFPAVPVGRSVFCDCNVLLACLESTLFTPSFSCTDLGSGLPFCAILFWYQPRLLPQKEPALSPLASLLCCATHLPQLLHRACTNKGLPARLQEGMYFMDLLVDMVREEIAECSEKACAALCALLFLTVLCSMCRGSSSLAEVVLSASHVLLRQS